MGHSTSSGRETEETRYNRQVEKDRAELEGLKPGEVARLGDSEVAYEKYSVKDIVNLLKDYDGIVPGDMVVAIKYTNGDIKIAGDGEKMPKLTGVSAAIIEGDYGYSFAGKGIRFWEYSAKNREWQRKHNQKVTDYDIDWRVDFA